MSQRAAYALIALVLASCMPSSSTGTTDDAVVSGPSVDGSVIPTVAKIVDSAANTWTVSAGVVYENGKLAGFSDGVTKLLYINGVIYQENSANNFWSWGGSTWVQTADPRNVSGSESNVPAMPLLVDASLNLWTLANGLVYENGALAGMTASVIELVYLNGTIYQQNSAGNWWSWTGTTWAATPNPTSARFAVSMDAPPVIGPFSTWANAKTWYAAAGDGVTDDTTALQKALNDLDKDPKGFYVLYLPAGDYRITASLQLTETHCYTGIEIIGEDPATTSITWDGPAGGTMLDINGGVNTRLSRITWNGAKPGNPQAGIGVAHFWNMATNPGCYGGSVEHTDEVFSGMATGIMAGRMGSDYGNMDSEGQIKRVKFVGNTQAGFDTGSWNALDWWIWDSQFIGCARGATNLFALNNVGNAVTGAGAFYIYRSLFEGSTVADVDVQNTGWFSMYENVSSKSRRFFQAENIGGNSSDIILAGNRVLNTSDPTAIDVANLGTVTLIDNQFSSSPGSAGPVVRMDDSVNGRDILTTGNSFTIANEVSITNAATDRHISVNDALVASSSISAVLPTMPSTPPWTTGQNVYEVQAGSSATAIQQIIDTAAAANSGVNSIVHFHPGSYTLSQTLTIPARSHVQLVGDGWGAQFHTSGAFLAMNFQGPSYATLRDVQFFSSMTPTVQVSGADQVGGRILATGNSFNNIAATSLGSTALEFQTTAGPTNGIQLTNVSHASFVGNGVIGPVNLTDSNALFYDTWYEGQQADLFRINAGNLTYLGGHLTPDDPNHKGPPAATPAILLDGFQGVATFVGVFMDLSGITNGVGIQIENSTAATQALFVGTANKSAFFDNTSAAGNVGLLLSKYEPANVAATSVPNQGDSSAAFITSSLAQSRSLKWEAAPYTPPAGATDFHIYRVKADQSPTGTTAGGVSFTGN